MNYFTLAFNAIKGLLALSKSGDNATGGNKMGNIGGYIAVGLGVFIVCLCFTIYMNRQQIKELQVQVKQGEVALEVQNTMIEANQAKNAELQKELVSAVEKARRDFSAIIMPNAEHKEAQNECEVFIKDLAKAYQK